MRKGKKIITGMWLEKLFEWPKQTTYLEPLRNLQRNNEGLVGENTKTLSNINAEYFTSLLFSMKTKQLQEEKGFTMYFLKIIVGLLNYKKKCKL